MNFHRTQVIGFVGRDPEETETDNGKVVHFSVATTERWRDGEGNAQEQTYWYDVSAWGRRGEIARDYLRKGSHVMVEGRAEARAYTDRDGKARASLGLNALNIRLMSKRDDEPNGNDRGRNGNDGRPDDDRRRNDDRRRSGSGGGQRASGSRGGGDRRSGQRSSGQRDGARRGSARRDDDRGDYDDRRGAPLEDPDDIPF